MSDRTPENKHCSPACTQAAALASLVWEHSKQNKNERDFRTNTDSSGATRHERGPHVRACVWHPGWASVAMTLTKRTPAFNTRLSLERRARTDVLMTRSLYFVGDGCARLQRWEMQVVIALYLSYERHGRRVEMVMRIRVSLALPSSK